MPVETPVILLISSDPDALRLRSAVLTPAGISCLYVQNAEQAVEVLASVPCDLVIICYTLDEENQQQMLDFLNSSRCGVRVLWMVPEDDCYRTGFLKKVEDALGKIPPIRSYIRDCLMASAFG
jgi:DNA-binding NtrC family response regulator